ncbi:hypothetical protein M5689_021743 [Euphorbia peplus]|nr:hypothetical protein M5689_021743 [Euphorbia peplus]
MANLCCSIETEPRTLREAQLNHAREVAADVVQKMEPKQVSPIFINKGLFRGVSTRPVVVIEEMEENINEGDEKNDGQECKEKVEVMLQSPCQCTIVNDFIDSPDPSLKLKEPFTAPF